MNNNDYIEIAAELEVLQKLIPVLHEAGYDDVHLFYEDCDVWVLQFHNPEHDGLTWELNGEFKGVRE